MQLFPATNLKNVYSPFHEAHGRVASGETFKIETADCFDGRLRDPAGFTPETLAWVEANLDLVTGPIHVEGVRAGDVVAVRIDAMAITTPGTLVLGPYTDPSPDDWWLDEDSSAAVPVTDGHVVLSDRLRVPVEPLVGCLATAPEDEVIRSRHGGDFGGNQDCRLMSTGATVILPARVDWCPGLLRRLQGADGVGRNRGGARGRDPAHGDRDTPAATGVDALASYRNGFPLGHRRVGHLAGRRVPAGLPRADAVDRRGHGRVAASDRVIAGDGRGHGGLPGEQPAAHGLLQRREAFVEQLEGPA